MAGRFFLGPRSGSGMSLRIMKNPAHNPATTPRTDYSKFAFDSESGNLAYAYGINANPNSLSYYPLITSAATYDGTWWEMPGWWEYAYSWGGRKAMTPNIGVVRQQFVPSVGSVVAEVANIAEPTFNPVATKYLMWQLPATNTAPPFPSSTGGVSRIYKSGSALRVPRVGISVTNGNPNNFILHEAIRPAKVIAAGRITVSGSGTTITLEGPISSNIFIGGHFSDQSGVVRMPYSVPVSFPVSTRRVQYQVLNGGRNIRFREINGRTVYLSYYVVAEDGSGKTSGSAPWLKGAVDDRGVSYMQVRRPGCDEPPNFADILVDSRWQSMPLIASGWIPKGSFSASGTSRRASVSIPSLGYPPLVLTSWQIDRMNFSGSFLVHRFFYEAMSSYYEQGGPSGDFNDWAGQTAYVTISDGSLQFVNYFPNPVGFQFDETPPAGVKPISGGNGDRTNWDDFVGVRYYVFAIPQG